MSLQVGQQLGSYQITSLLGKGGMGEVYRARDSKLKREVAIKILPDEFSRDTERVARFQREAEVLASLNHPHIAAIHHLEEVGDSRLLVMELVEGETLADRLKRGAIPVNEALAIARQIAEALEATHAKGIVHRDLKPANIKFTRDGSVKVLDFGLAKVRETDGRSAILSNSPTMMSASTPGMIMGTAAYMSPEQAKGQESDCTSDVWAFGCVFYEMLAGRPVFEGETVGEILGGIFKAEPDWRRLPAETPEGIRRLLRRCLQKDSKFRLQHIGDARIEIHEAQSGPSIEGSLAARGSRGGQRVWITAFAMATLIAVVLAVFAFRPVAAPPEMRVEITTPPTTDPVSMAISPDGQKIVFTASSNGQSQLWLRPLDAVSARPLPGTEGGQYPFWSPDSRSIGFLGENKLKRIDIDGGSVQTLFNAPGFRGGAWNRDGVILFNQTLASPIFRLPSTGGEPVPVITSQQQRGYRSGQFLPDGRHFLYYVQGDPEIRGVYIGELDTSGTQRLFDADAPAVYTSFGQLLFVRQATLFAQNFDPVRLALTGNPFPLAEQVTVDAANNLAALSASAAGPIIYRTGGAGGQRQFVWYDRFGKEIGKAGDPDNTAPVGPSISPDGRRVALQRTINGNADTWLLDLVRGLLTRFTFDVAVDGYPIWRPDGSRIVFNSNRNANGIFDLYQKPASGTGTEELLLATDQTKTPADWSADGRFLLYRSLDPKTNYDIWALPMDGDRKPFPVVRTNFVERDGQFSPDGKWVAYQSNESGRMEIYMQPFPGPGGKMQISTNGGAQVRWRRDGKELFYIALDGRLMAVPVRFNSSGQTIEADSPVALFATHIGGAVRGFDRQGYLVSADGQLFLMNTISDEITSPITVILNWRPPKN